MVTRTGFGAHLGFFRGTRSVFWKGPTVCFGYLQQVWRAPQRVLGVHAGHPQHVLEIPAGYFGSTRSGFAVPTACPEGTRSLCRGTCSVWKVTSGCFGKVLVACLRDLSVFSVGIRIVCCSPGNTSDLESVCSWFLDLHEAVFRVVATLDLWGGNWILAEGTSVLERISAELFESLLERVCL